ncbi:F-box domain-containing protein [Pochonia chlamydosporia 170]|uniref:F-box domain-containing protein n=1 Tax=Pochonia chlamydosporia 170 TaxID=1380566 RepID=A0A179FSZ0_METCM|nr:F-box domain-containing protein [Pochonia chlamydosporia 170]OAQ68320.1 F-box domain-containing protein [Pochonia chlamydosporia 170]
MAQVPVEVFDIITSYLTRAEVRNLRLVCREFEAKILAQYFRNVVVPFRSELYSGLSRNQDGTLKHSTSSLFSNGMHIFESFGPHILRFALSLELDEDSLAYPPVKSTQEAVPAFWGIYRWPHKSYHRYTDLEGLEQTADETEGMKAALRCLTKVRNIGLCCDAGLGFLLGPDKRARDTIVQHPVFATVDWRRHQRSSQRARQPAITVADFNDVARDPNHSTFPNPMAFRNTILERMAADAGYTGHQVPEAVRIMLDTENTNLKDINFDERSSPLSPSFDLDGELRQLVPFTSFREASNTPLIPTNLTRAQKEMLLELEWAHRAMIQSYVLAMIDNASIGCFRNVTTFTIAKIPGGHVHLLCRQDLWESIPGLKNVSLGVVADWRKLTASTPGFVEDMSISPVESFGKVFTLLNDHIAKCRSIESIHFEWICGGELAPSSYQRNSYILPVPFINPPGCMVIPTAVRDDQRNLLHLPYIKHLSLKNCWSSPHIFLQTVRQFALSSLEKLELESVSLSGPPTAVAQGPLINAAVAIPVQLGPPALADDDDADDDNDLELDVALDELPLASVLQLPLPQLMLSINPPTNDSNQSLTDRLHQPDLLTWAGLIDHFSPSVKIKQLLAEQADDDAVSTASAVNVDIVARYIPHADDLPKDELRYRLGCLSFKSCGYVTVDTPYLDTRAVLSESHIGHTVAHVNNQDITSLMQSSKDMLLARITQWIPKQEEVILTTGFGMSMGWKGIYEARVIDDAIADGVRKPGCGRFSGEIEGYDDTVYYHEEASLR